MRAIVCALSAVALVLLSPLPSDGQETGAGESEQTQAEPGPPAEVIFGRELMTPEEIERHRAKMRSLKTREERRAFREEHHRQMLERARERGVTLPADPPPRGRRGEGVGPAPGKRVGPGAGPGMRRGPAAETGRRGPPDVGARPPEKKEKDR